MFPDTPNQEDSKGRLKIILTLVLLVAIGIGGYFFFSTKSNKAESLQQTTEQSSIANPSSGIEYLSYSNQDFGISFTYPKEFGNATTSSFKIGVSQNDLEKLFLPGLNIEAEKVIPIGYNIYFDGRACFSSSCGIGIQIREYSSTTPYEVECYEGECSMTNHLNESVSIQKMFNFSSNGTNWYCRDFFLPSRVARSCKAYHNNTFFDFQMGYGTEFVDTSDDKVWEIIIAKDFQMDNLTTYMTDVNDFMLMESRYESILKSIVLE